MMQSRDRSKQQLLYFYDLPVEEMTFVKLTKLIQEVTGHTITIPPQFIKYKHEKMNENFTMAAVKFNVTDEQFDRYAEQLRYFKVDGKPGRALKFDHRITAAHRDTLN